MIYARTIFKSFFIYFYLGVADMNYYTVLSGMKQLKILVACEESQAVAIALRELGHMAYSCDTLPCSGKHPEYHLKMDAIRAIAGPGHKSGYVGNLLTEQGDGFFIDKWDCIIAFPPCTYLCFAGIRWNTNNPIREQQTLDAVEFFKKILNSNCKYIAIENPVGVIPRRTGVKWSQMIHPWQFGDPQEKKTCIWLKNLPLLIPTDIVKVREQKIFRKSALAGPGSSKHRSFYRSKTFPGIAKAMAAQWSDYILNN